ncbi:MAG: hypothetical protein ABSA21_03260 [Candidatus Limnocylindrales bacterium]
MSVAPNGTPTPTAVPSARGTDAPEPRLLVLADGVENGVGLWTYVSGAWTAQWPLPGATALARDGQSLTLAVDGSLDSRSVAVPQASVASLGVSWRPTPPSGPIVGLDRSDSGATAVVVSESSSLTFAVVAADGTASLLSPPPDSPFGPSVAWLDSDRLVAISADARQIPRLAVIDTAGHKIALVSGLGGVRVFTLSPDRGTLAAATESAVYVARVGDWLADEQPEAAVTLRSSQVVWDLALSADGSRLAMLSGAEDAAGTVGDIHEIVYVYGDSAWDRAVDSPVPFSLTLGQVWLN